ncbi:MAG: type VII secretion protein EssC, partial [Lachnospiraceae bacterium]|nr:type VII secretion protein EssC [Lachnospiraceae bacterium]
MAETKNNLMADFLVTFFIGNHAISRMLSDVVKNRNSRLYAETIGLPEGYAIPFFQEEKDGTVFYIVKHHYDGLFEPSLEGNPCNNHIIQSGDYITFKGHNENAVFRALFLASADIELGYQKYRVENNTNIFIGRTTINDISFDFTDYISREKHAVIRIDDGGNAYIEDLKRSVGIYVNGKRTHSHKLSPFDEIFMMGLSIVYMGSYISIRNFRIECGLGAMDAFPVKAPLSANKNTEYFVSTPRILKSLDSGEIEVDAPPNPPSMDKTPAILTIGPSLTMSMVMLASLGVSMTSALSGGNIPTLIASSTMAVGMLLGSLLWPSLLRSYQKRSVAHEEKHRRDRYSAYIREIEKQLAARAERSVRLLNDSMSPSPGILCSLLDDAASRLRLWERSYEDTDFLAVRLGLGDRPFDVSIKVPRQGFQLHDDDMRELPAALSKKYVTLSNVPLTLNISDNRTIGIIGDSENIKTILDEVILNVIALHSYDEVKLVFIVPPKQAQIFEMYKNVPHVWSDDKKVRFFATNTDEVHFVFNVIDEALRNRETLENGNAVSVPHYILIITEPSMVEKEALGRYMYDADNKVGLTSIFAYGDITRLPKSCRTIIQSDESRTGYYIKNMNSNRFIPFSPDSTDKVQMSSFVNKLSHLNIRRSQRSLGIAEQVSFLQMYKAGNVSELNIEQHWDSNNSAKSLAAPIGVVAGGEVFSLDIHEAYHGCHGLVAGTTGSGKSEFLQAFVLSLAVNFSPREVAFVLVDFKGGDMARPFMSKPFSPALPHLAATISNLSGNILYRALVSLEAEIKSRQRLFNESAAALGVDKLDINSYHKYYKGGKLTVPLPHLVIIIDEFAQLKTQQPEFLAQLINVAQVGRSLGVHLILATQKPSGIVDPQIMSNSRFKVCLKVAEKQDSIDMINKPDSAMIKNPGRLYIQVGYDEIYECIQSGYSGADYIPVKTYMPDEEITVQMTDNTAAAVHSAKLDLSGDKSDKTQMEAIVAEIVSLGQKKDVRVKPLWMDMLPKKVLLGLLTNEGKGLCQATVGIVDYVRTQEQKPLTIDFTKTGHIALYGASGTGKTTFLHTMVYSMVNDYGYTPDELNIYALDFGSRNLGYLDTLPHSGGVVFADDEQKLSELISVLHGLVEERKKLFAAGNCGTFTDYRAISRSVLPAVVVLIDNYSSFRDKYMDMADSLTEIISAGKTFGLYFVITGSTRNSIYYRVTEHIAAYLTLKMNDPGNYLDILNGRPPIMPEDISGRGIMVIDGEVVEFQIAVAADGENEAERLSAICD